MRNMVFFDFPCEMLHSFYIFADRRIAVTNNSNWFPTKQQLKDYKYHDIVAHRVVEYEQVKTKPKPRISIEEKEQNRINARKSNREHREKKEAITKENRIVQLEEREAQVRYVMLLF